MFLENMLANFLGSLAAALVLWLLVTNVYEISRSKKNKDDLMGVSYGLIKREIDAASQFCRDHVSAGIDYISANGPITQAWETLHSMEAFKYFPPTLSEKLVKYYSLLFRLKENVEMEQMLFANRGVPVPGADPMAVVQQNLRSRENLVCRDLLSLESRLQSAIDSEVLKLGKTGRHIFEEAYEKRPGRAN
jgi:hypothetical protein